LHVGVLLYVAQVKLKIDAEIMEKYFFRMKTIKQGKERREK